MSNKTTIKDMSMKVSVVIPVYNVMPYLERCVQSVLRQTYKDLEIILVDDGSSDDSGILCDQLATKDSRILVIHQQNQGLSGARNTGIRHATGEYIIFVDSDDEWLIDNGVETFVKKCDATTDLVMFKAIDIWSHDKRTNMPDYNLDEISQLPDAQSVFSYLIHKQIFRASVALLMIRRKILIDNHIYFPDRLISEDVYWDMELWQHIHSVKVTNLSFYGYYHRAQSLSTSHSIRVYNSYDTIFTYWKGQCDSGCVNQQPIRIYLANMWVSMGYELYLIPNADKPEALHILKKHVDLLNDSYSHKAKRTRLLVKLLGVKLTVFILGCYWQLRNYIKH